MSRFLLAMVVTVGLVGCGGAADSDKQDTQQGARQFQNATITRNPDSTFTLKAGDQTLSNISSFQVSEQEQESKDVSAFLAAEPVAEEPGGGGSLCCTSCSLSGGVLICTGCRRC
jgi:hypothetical protein